MLLDRIRSLGLTLTIAWLGSLEDKFTLIYRTNYWSSETPSGHGSTFEYTANLRKELPSLFRDWEIKSVLDVPCGDYSWMQKILCEIDVEYVGGDIVKPLINDLSEKYGTDKTRFVHLDLTVDSLPKTHLLFNRDCLFHFSYQDIKLVLANFLKSGTPYFMTTTHVNLDDFDNFDITTGGFRLIDIFSTPFNFPKNPLATVNDWLPPDNPRVMCLFERNQVAEALNSFGKS